MRKKQKRINYILNTTEVLKTILYALLISGIVGFLALKVNFIFMVVGLIIIPLFIIYNVLRLVKIRTLSLTSIVRDNNGNLYLIINNNMNDLSWFVAADNILKKSFLGAAVGTTVSIKLLHDVNKKYEILKQLCLTKNF